MVRQKEIERVLLRQIQSGPVQFEIPLRHPGKGVR